MSFMMKFGSFTMPTMKLSEKETFRKDNEVWQTFLSIANELEEAAEDFYQQKTKED
jgi:rubrerythrin